MGGKSVYPRSNAECIALLKRLGFKRKFGSGRGNHPQKYIHPKRNNQAVDDKPFILITHEYFDANGKRLMKKLQNWGFTAEEIREACKKS